MKSIKNYKDRFFSLLESEMGNVKPLIVEQVSDDEREIIVKKVVDTFGFDKTNEEDGDGIKKITLKKKIGGDKELGLLLGFNDPNSAMSNVIVLIPFLKKEGGMFQKATKEIFGGNEEFISIPSKDFNNSGMAKIAQMLELIDEHGYGDEFGEESADYTEMIKDLMEKNGFSQVKTDDGSMLFVKKINQGKSFLIKIKEEGSMVKILPLVFDHEAHKNPIFYGKELPVRVGTINIERNQRDNPEVLSLDIDKEDISGSESKITQAIEKGERLAKEYMSKFDAMKKLEDDSDFKLR